MTRAERNCYGLEPELLEYDGTGECSVEQLRDWVGRTRALGLRLAAPRFVVKLDRLSRVALPPGERTDALRLLLRPILTLAAELPDPLNVGGARVESGAILLRQRLYCLLVKNLKQALRDIDRSEAVFDRRSEADRQWVTARLFRVLGRQVELSVELGLPDPPGTWRELHDLYAYLLGRADLGVAAHEDPGSDLPAQYRRLLLLGLAKRLVGDRRIPSETLERLAVWATRTRLEDPEAHVGQIRPFTVEIALDEPPRQLDRLLAAGFRGFVLVPPPDFAGAVEAARFGLGQGSPWTLLAATSAYG